MNTLPTFGSSTHINVTEIDPNLQWYSLMDEYAGVKLRCFDDYHVEQDWKAALEEASRHFTECQTSDRLLARASVGDPEGMMDIALRYLSGCGMRKKNLENALLILDAFVDPDCTEPAYVGDVIPRLLKARAHGSAAHAYLDKVLATPAERAVITADERRFQRKETMELGAGAPAFVYLAIALHHANESVKLGLVSPVTLRLGLMMRDVGTSLGVDLSQMARSRRFRPLWSAANARQEEIYAEERLRQRKAAKEPAAYVCAAEGCKIRGEEKQSLRSCAGKCPPDLKPHYCSKECQKKDWPRHKPICKPGSGAKLPDTTGAAKSLALGIFELEDSANADDGGGASSPGAGPSQNSSNRHDAPFGLRPQGPGQIIEVPAPNAPGGTIRITSNTLDAQSLREIREYASSHVGNSSAS